jgi:cell division protein FtsB
MPQVSDPQPGLRRSGGVEPLRRQRVAPAPASSSPARRRALNFLLIFVTLVLVADALIGEKGLSQSVHARRQYREVAASLDALRRDNIRLRDEARRLREDPGAIESMAREQLGLIRPGEVLFIIKDEKPSR